MKTLSASQPFPREASAARFESARTLAFSIAESSPYDTYQHFGPGPYVNLHDAAGNGLIRKLS